MHRRRILTGAGALAVLLALAPRALAPRALAQQGAPDEDEPPLAPEVLALLPNITTRLAVSTTVNGAGPYEFVVDTGASRTTISDAVAEALALPPGPDVVVNGVTSAEPARTVIAGEIEVAGVRLRNVNMPVFPRRRLAADGLLGLDALSQFRLVFDLKRRRLIMGLSVREARSSERASRLGYDIAVRARPRLGQLVFSQVRIDGVDLTAFIDSGSQYTIGNLALMRAVDARRPNSLYPRWNVPIIGVTGQRRTGELAMVDSMRIAGFNLHETAIVFSDLHIFDYLGLRDVPALLMGADTLGRMDRVTMDFARDRVLFSRPN